MSLVKRLAEKREKWRTWYLSWHETEPDERAEIVFFINAIADELAEIVQANGFEPKPTQIARRARMGKYRKKPVVIEATQWFKNGDHPADRGDSEFTTEDSEGQVVRRFRRPNVIGAALCGGTPTRKGCGQPMHDHGWIDTIEGGHTVCPGDWIITGVAGERYPCKPDIFDLTYEAVDSAESD